jgi:peptidoglycan/LPS O-acetylase OafA/YrhL
MFKQFFFLIVPGGFFAVDSFFWLSGFLVAALMTGKLIKNGMNKVPLIFFHRFYRLAPSILLLTGFTTCIYIFLSDGPMWGSMV